MTPCYIVIGWKSNNKMAFICYKNMKKIDL